MKILTVSVLVLAMLAFMLVSIKPQSTPELRVASASSFAPFLSAITEDVQRQCQFKLRISSGSSGMLATQILNGGPFDVFFSADAARPAQLVQKGKAKAAQTYAIGRLVYWRPPGKNPVANDRRPLAMADPKLAPYGQAALQSLVRLRQNNQIPGETVWGRSAAQVFQFVATGAAQAGLVPLSLVRMAGVSQDEYFLVPSDWHRPIRQDMVVLHPSLATECLLGFLRAPRTIAMMAEAGFEVAP